MPAKKPAASPRRELLRSQAAKLFAERGFHGVSIGEIGAAAGISGPAVYRHFTSKEALLGEILVGISEWLLISGTVSATAAGDPHAALEELITFHIDFALDNPELITVQDRDLASTCEEDRLRVRRLQRGYVEIWVSALRTLHPDTTEVTARAAAHSVFGMINSTPHSAHLDRADMAALLHRMARAALSAACELPTTP